MKNFHHFQSMARSPSSHILYDHLTSVCSEKAADGKSYVNPPAAKPSLAYDAFVSPISNDSRGGFDVHIYFQQNIDFEVKFATELWERIRRECELLSNEF